MIRLYGVLLIRLQRLFVQHFIFQNFIIITYG